MSKASGARPVHAPLLVTAELPGDVLVWADRLRNAHYPPERRRMGAHVTLLHALPPSAEPEVRRLLAELACEAPPPARVTGLMDLDPGTAFAVDSPDIKRLHAEMSDRLHGLIQQKDDRPLRPHITVQAKVAPEAAARLRAELERDFTPRSFRFRGLGLYVWRDELWNLEHLFPFRGLE